MNSSQESGIRIEPLEDPFDLMLVGWSFLRSRVLVAAIELKLFDTLADGPLTGEELRIRLGVHERGAEDFFDSLVSFGILDRQADRYHNAPGAETYLVSAKPTYIGDFVAITTELMGRGSEDFAQTLRSGQARGQGEKGEVPFAKVFQNPVTLRGFLKGMDSLNGVVGPALAEAFEWGTCQRFADLGGARGNLAATLARAHPHLEGIVMDRPAMKGFFEEHVGGLGVLDRVVFQGGNFFTDELPEADVYVFGNVLHDFGAQQRADLIEKAAHRLPPGGAVVVYDPMLDEDRSREGNLLLSLSLILQSPTGGEYPPSSCVLAMRTAGLIVEDVRGLPASTTLVVGRKPLT